MASVCVKKVDTSPAKLSTASYSKTSVVMSGESPPLDMKSSEKEDLVDFEFLLEDPVTMLSADELFSDGKLVPLKFSGESKTEEKAVTTAENEKPRRRLEMEISGAVVDPYLFSPRAPRCTVRWRELLGLKRLAKTREEALSSSSSPSPSPSSRLSSSSPNIKTASFRHFLNRNSKPTTAPPPPPPQTDISESSTSLSSSRLSLSSSSSSGHELDELPRLSLDLDKPTTAPNPFAKSRAHHHLRKPRRHSPADESPENEARGVITVTADSPRLNASGKIVFHGLERSSSSPGNFTGGPRMKQQHHGMPRSHSANVRITPVLNVPVSSLRGGGGHKSNLFFGHLFSSSSSSVSSSGNRAKNRTNRTRLEPTSEL